MRIQQAAAGVMAALCLWGAGSGWRAAEIRGRADIPWLEQAMGRAAYTQAQREYRRTFSNRWVKTDTVQRYWEHRWGRKLAPCLKR